MTARSSARSSISSSLLRPTIGESRCRSCPAVSVRTVSRRNAGTGLLLALQVERGDRLHLDRILHQPIGRLAEEDLAGRSGLLQSGGDVHRVTRHETLAGGRVTGNDFTGVHPDPSRDPDAVLAFELEVERLQRLPHAGGGPDRAQRVVLVQPGDPEDGHHRIADELLDGPAVSFDHADISSKYRPMTRRSASGSSRSPRDVEPVTSAKTIVTTLRTSGATPSVSSSGVAQFWQKRALSAFSSPQDGHRFTGAS